MSNNERALFEGAIVSYANALGEDCAGVSIKVSRCIAEPFQVEVTLSIDPVLCRRVSVVHLPASDSSA